MAEELPGQNLACWTALAADKRWPSLEGDLSVDVAVIGAGIVGVTTALLLKQAGRRVALIDAKRVGTQVSGGSTGKVTSQHSLIYADLISRLGEDKARIYAEANEAALARIGQFVEAFDLDCSFERRPAYTFTSSADRVQEIEREVDCAKRLGLPATLVTETPLPYGIAAAIRFDNQAQFDPVAYLQGVAKKVDGDGGHVFESTLARLVRHGAPCTIETDKGTITATDVVVATNMPFISEGEFYQKASPRAHLAMAARIREDRDPGGMFLCIDSPTHSIRTAPYFNGGRMLVIIGESFATGHVSDTVAMYRSLAAFVREHFVDAEILYRWRNEDYDSQDRVPFVGRATAESEHLYVATGLSSWGFTNGTAAGILIADTILGNRNPWAELYDSTREPGEAPNKGHPPMAEDQGAPPKPSRYEDLQPGQGAVFRIGDRPVAVSRQADNSLCAVSAECTHLGCEVSWNTAEQSWDCPCHGSLFSADGAVLHGPAVQDLERIAVDRLGASDKSR